MNDKRRPHLLIYLALETGCILALGYITFVSGTYVGLELKPKLISQAIPGALLGVWLVSKLAPGWFWPRQRAWPTTPLDRAILACLGVVALSTIFSIHPRLSLESAILIYTYALTFWLSYELMQERWLAQLAIKCLLIVGGIACVFATLVLVRWYLGYPDGPAWPSLGLGIWPRVWPRLGAFGSPNHLASYLAMLAPVALACGMAAGYWPRRLSLWGLAIWAATLAVITQSRGGLLGLLGGLCVVALGSWPSLAERWPGLRPTGRRVLLVGLVLLILCASVVAVMQWHGRDWIRGILGRLDAWELALRIAAHHPLVGVGPGTFGMAYLQYRGTDLIYEVHSHAHSLILHALASLGVVGLLAHFWLAATFAVTAWRRWRAETERARRWLRLASVAGLASIAVHGLFDTLGFQFPGLIAAAIILMVVAISPVKPPTADKPLARRWWLAPGLATGGAVLCLGVVAWSDLALTAYDQAVAASWGDWKGAVQWLETAVHRDPGFGYYGLQLGLAYGQLAAQDRAYLTQAIAAYQAGGIERDYDASNHANMAWLLWESGERSAALDHMRRAVQLAKGRPYPDTDFMLVNYYVNLGVMLEETGDFEEARLAYARAVALYPQLLTLSFWDSGMPAARARDGLATAAADLLSPASERDNAYQRGLIALWLQRYDEAHVWFQHALEAAPDDQDAWWGLGCAELAAGRPEAALTAAEHVLSLQPFAAKALSLRAQADLALGRLEQAATDLALLRFLLPDHETWMTMGQLAEARGDYEAATRHYRSALTAAQQVRSIGYGPTVWSRAPLSTESVPFRLWPAQAPQQVAAYLALGRVYARQGQISAARQAYQTVLQIDHGQPEALQALARLGSP